MTEDEFQNGVFAPNQDEMRERIVRDFEADPWAVSEYAIVFFRDNYENYQGEAFIVLCNVITREWFVVSASHCSCYGFEGQFLPTAVTYAYLISEHNPEWNNGEKAEFQRRFRE